MEKSQRHTGFLIVCKGFFLLGGLFYAWAMTRTHAVYLAALEFGLSIYLLSLFTGSVANPSRATNLVFLPRLSLRWWFILLSLPLIWLGYQVNLVQRELVWVNAEKDFVAKVQRMNGHIQNRTVRNYWKSRGIAPWVGSLFVENVEAVTSVAFLLDAPIKDSDLQSLNLNRHPTLEVVRLAHHPITDQGIEEINALPNLHRLDLMRTNVTGSTAFPKSLTVLNLGGTKVGDESIHRLRDLTKLQFLTLPGEVSDRVVAELQAELPGCTINRLLPPR